MIGIFGDSFAECLPTHSIGWPLLVKEKATEPVEIHAAGGSSLFWSYQNFLKFQNNYDRIIFIVTNPTRYTKPLNFRGKSVHLNSIDTIEHHKAAYSLGEEEERILSDLTAFYRIADIDWDILSCQMLVERILKIRPDTILVPIAIKDTSFSADTTSMYDFVFYQLKCLGMSLSFDKFYSRYTENMMACHFTDEINNLVCDLMLESLRVGKWVGRIPDELIRHAKPFESYYTRIST